MSSPVEIRDIDTGTLLDTVYTYLTPREFEQATGDTGWQTHTVDLSAFAGRYVELAFVERVPQIFTGPAQLEIDDIKLLNMPAPAPDIDEFEVDFTGKTGKLVDVIFTSGEADFEGSLVELLDTDGTTVLATGSTEPYASGSKVSNYRQAISGFAVPADGVYTIRVTSNVFGPYDLLVNESVVFDSEPNDTFDAALLRSLDGAGGALGFVDGEQLYVGSAIAYAPEDISDTTFYVFLGDDAVTTTRRPIFFDFDYYNDTYSSYNVSSNGFLTFLDNQSHGLLFTAPVSVSQQSKRCHCRMVG